METANNTRATEALGGSGQPPTSAVPSQALTAIPRRWEEAAALMRRKNASTLEPWQEVHAKWKAFAEKPIPLTKQALACSGLAGRLVSVEEVRALRDNRAWRNLVASLRADRQEKIDEARAIMNETLPEAAALQQRAIRELNNAEPGKLDIRAIPPITQPYLERVWPKKSEQETHATVVTINLSAEQLRGLNTPSSKVIAEDAVVLSIENAK